ncbi:hypothetical protein F0562_029739 [Nyssa sinensis]|uniref:Epidermal patterning factor-like protein n=1 Tax=Nyssa sinensis TaxID=561372 RepID=A0A5J5AWK2_9ASTE|nr:hypothetical protein F0562_029739 [Nyssa sinensis]
MFKMRRRICSFLIVSLQIVSWVSATSRPFATHDVVHQQDTGQILHSPQIVSESTQGLQRKEGEQGYKGQSKLGSRPPNCEHKCGGCIPCNAIQVPTTTGHLGVQYANYEPEGWKCKCGTSFFNP